MTKAIWVVIIIAVLVLGGYFLFRGGAQTPSPTPAPEESPKAEAPAIREFAVVGDEYSYSPSSITVSAGDKVKIIFSNKGNIRHNLVVEGLGASTASISPGQTETIEFTAPDSGTYTFFCSISGHRAAGMEGALEVE